MHIPHFDLLSYKYNFKTLLHHAEKIRLCIFVLKITGKKIKLCNFILDITRRDK